MTTIRLADRNDLSVFHHYMDQLLSENGVAGTPLFQPVPRSELRVGHELREAFEAGLSVEVGQPRWRRLMIAVKGEEVVGHADLRGYRKATARHRALMGMGVSRGFRRAGVGTALVEGMLAWADQQRGFEYVDLWVLSDNQPARRLYERLGFSVCGEIKDMFRVDGKVCDYTMMVRQLGR